MDDSTGTSEQVIKQRATGFDGAFEVYLEVKPSPAQLSKKMIFLVYTRVLH
jgi:hypothetical protein